MSMSLGTVLRDHSLVRADPVLLTDRKHAARIVRWVHSSEVLDIAPLLRGGELLVTGGIAGDPGPSVDIRYGTSSSRRLES